MMLVMIDRLSKWTDLVPLRSATAESLKKAFRERIIAIIIITDNRVSDNNSPHHIYPKRIRPNEQTEQSRL